MSAQADLSVATATATPTERSGWRPRAVAVGVLVLLALPFTVLGVLQARSDGPVVDEPLYLTAGITALREREIRINFEHPPLAKVLAALPALLADPVVPTGDAWEEGDQWRVQSEFLAAQQEAGTLARVLFLGRLVPLGIGVAVGFLLYALTATLHGRAAGVLAGALWFTSPFALGLSHVLTIDIPFVAATLLVALALVRALRRSSWLDPVLVGLACGVAVLTRVTGFVLVAVACLAVGGGAWRRQGAGRALARAAVVALVAYLCVWGGYRGLASPLPAYPDPATLPTLIEAPPEIPASAGLLTLVPWPQELDVGLRYLARVSLPPAPGYSLGSMWDGANLWYWPGSMAAKLPVGTCAVLAAGLLLRAGRRRLARAEVLLAVLLPAALLALLTVVQPRQIGLRYLLPSIVLALVASAWVAGWLWSRRGRWALGALALTQVAALASAHPHSLSWTTPPFRPAYRYVTDTNLDWSQDFPLLQRWARGRRPWVAFLGPPWYEPEDDVPGARQLVGADPATVRGDVAVSATLLTAYQRDALSWLRAYCPVGTLGGSVVLYRFEAPPDTRPGPVQPAAPCAGDVSERAYDQPR
jgi:hypothetical protein